MSSEVFHSHTVVRLDDTQAPYSEGIKHEMAYVRMGAWKQATDAIQKRNINRLHVNLASTAYEEGFEYMGQRISDFTFKALQASEIEGSFDLIELRFVARVKVTYLVNTGPNKFDLFSRISPSMEPFDYAELEHKVMALFSSAPFSTGSVTGRISESPQPQYYNFPRLFKPVTRWERFKASWFWQGLQIPTSEGN